MADANHTIRDQFDLLPSGRRTSSTKHLKCITPVILGAFCSFFFSRNLTLVGAFCSCFSFLEINPCKMDYKWPQKYCLQQQTFRGTCTINFNKIQTKLSFLEQFLIFYVRSHDFKCNNPGLGQSELCSARYDPIKYSENMTQSNLALDIATWLLVVKKHHTMFLVSFAGLLFYLYNSYNDVQVIFSLTKLLLG